jgi:predicted kinase
VLVVMVGLPGSGKSTYARTNFRNIVSPDRIRLEQFGTAFDPDIEQEVWDGAFGEARRLLGAGAVVCFDATSVSRRRRFRLVHLARELGAPAVVVWVRVEPEVAWGRNAARERPVPREAFDRLVQAFEPPSAEEEGFLAVVEIPPGNGAMERETGAP